jgi:DNA-binding NarL/FixJ family response regulator
MMDHAGVLHVEDEEAFPTVFHPIFENRQIDYHCVGLVSEAAPYISSPEISGFILDCRLPSEKPSAFQAWGDYEQNAIGLLRKIRAQRPEVPVDVLTDFPDTPELQELIRAGILEASSLHKKDGLDSGQFVRRCAERLSSYLRAQQERAERVLRERLEQEAASDLAGELPVELRASLWHEGVVLPGEKITLHVRVTPEDALAARPSAHESAALQVTVQIASPDLIFDTGHSYATFVVSSSPAASAQILSAEVRADIEPEHFVEILATLTHKGRFCGIMRRRLSVGASPAALETTSPASGAGEGSARLVIEPRAAAPLLTVSIVCRDSSKSGVLDWVVSLREPILDAPDCWWGIIDLGCEPSRFIAELVARFSHLPGDRYMDYFRSFGELLYEKSPPCFRDIYRALRAVHDRDFAIQFVVNEPRIPWELMWPTDVPSSTRSIAVDHPVARCLAAYQGRMVNALHPGVIASIAPDYIDHPSARPLPAARQEALALRDRFAALLVRGLHHDVMSLLKSGLEQRVAILHFAGHGQSHLGLGAGRLVLEDADLHALEIRNQSITLGRKDRSLVILNACELGAAGLMPEAIGSWAEALAHRHFGGFIAPLWPVVDAHAKSLVLELVEEVFRNRKSIGAALRAIRDPLDATEPVSPTALSYVYFGDVMAQFKDGDSLPPPSPLSS